MARRKRGRQAKQYFHKERLEIHHGRIFLRYWKLLFSRKMEMMRFQRQRGGALSAQDHSVTGINGYVDIHGIFYVLFILLGGETKLYYI